MTGSLTALTVALGRQPEVRGRALGGGSAGYVRACAGDVAKDRRDGLVEIVVERELERATVEPVADRRAVTAAGPRGHAL
jgi:hypothetical protein